VSEGKLKYLLPGSRTPRQEELLGSYGRAEGGIAQAQAELDSASGMIAGYDREGDEFYVARRAVWSMLGLVATTTVGGSVLPAFIHYGLKEVFGFDGNGFSYYSGALITYAVVARFSRDWIWPLRWLANAFTANK
jgi:hypothetical protein